MKYMILLLLITTTLPLRAASAPPPLTAEQITRIQELIRKNQTSDAKVRAELKTKQLQLTKAYEDFRLDDQRAGVLQKEILGLQQRLLTNYHQLQFGLRKTVGEERFYLIKRRIDNHLKSQAVKATPKAAKKTNSQ
jgi:hypothetical protein